MTVLSCDRTPLQARIMELLAVCDADALSPCGVDGDVAQVIAARLPPATPNAVLDALVGLRESGAIVLSSNASGSAWEQTWIPRPAPDVPQPTRTVPRRAPIREDDRRLVLERDEHCCVLCGATDDLTLDHIFPQSLGGSGHPINLRVLCRSCNSRKGAAIPDAIRLVGP